MRHLNDHRKLGRTSAHRLAMLRNMVCSLIEHGRIVTTLPKAKEASRYAEKCITLGKKSAEASDPAKKLHYRRQAMTALHDVKAVTKLVEEVAPTYKDRKGGYTRVLKAGFRLGDHGAKAIFELV
ncbi:MAG: 50S ribosomal protein L17 [Planctomycetes bacterium]|nr:50S ribosomal protein L17 [Planctomycetota bacterium]